MNGKIIALVLLVLVVPTVFVAPAAGQVGIDGNESGSGTSTPTETPDNTTQNDSGEADVSTQVMDVSPILTVNKAEWYGGNNTVVVTVTADTKHEVTKVWQSGDGQFRKSTVTVPQGKSKILVNSNGYDKVQLWSQNYGRTLESPNLDLFDLPPSEWPITYRVFFGSIFGTLLAVVVVYFRKKHQIENKIRSIFEMEWW